MSSNSSGIVFQGSLGNVADVKRKDQNMFGYIALASIIKVYEKHNTVDVKLIRSNNRITGSANNEGRFSCRVLCSNAGYDSTNQISWGVKEPLSEGQTVAVTFLDGMKDEPIIIGVIHDVDNSNNILTSTFPLDPSNSYSDLKDTRKFLRVFPLQDYLKVDGMGNLEFALHSKSFISWSEGISDETTDFKDLSENAKSSGNTLQLPTNYQDEFGNGYSFYTNPKNFLMVFRDSVDDVSSTKTKVFVDMSKDKGTLRLTRDNNDTTLSYIELSKDGSIKFKRQLDSNKRDSGSSYSDIIIDSSGKITLENSKGSSMIMDGNSINFVGNFYVNGTKI